MVATALSFARDWPRQPMDRPCGADSSTATHQLEDTAIAAMMASGDAAALHLLYLHYRAAAFAAAYTLLRDACAAEDVVQDAFLRAWRSAASYHPERGSLRSWLLTIVRNTAIDQLRARGIAQRYQPRLVHEAVDAEGEDDVAATVAGAADARRLQRHALELAFFGGLTHGEIAAHTGAPLGTVKGRVRLGLRRLRQELADLAPAMPAKRDLHQHAA